MKPDDLDSAVLRAIEEHGPSTAWFINVLAHWPHPKMNTLASTEGSLRRLRARGQVQGLRSPTGNMIYHTERQTEAAAQQIRDLRERMSSRRVQHSASPIEAAILARLADGSWHESQELRRSISNHQACDKTSIYTALRALIRRGKIRKRFDGPERGRRYSVWSVQACAASKKKPRPPERSGHTVIIRPRIVSADDLRSS